MTRKKEFDIKKTLYWHLKHGDNSLNKLFHLGVISYRTIRGIKIADNIYQEHCENGRDLRIVISETAEIFSLQPDTVRDIWYKMIKKM